MDLFSALMVFGDIAGLFVLALRAHDISALGPGHACSLTSNSDGIM